MALEPGPDAKGALAAWRDGLIAGRDDLRPTAAETLHLTLAFLGYRPEKEIEAIAAALHGAAEGAAAPVLAPAGVVPLPRKRPRLFALDLADPSSGCADLQQLISDVLESQRFYRPGKRPFWPHMTLARVKSDRRAGPLPSTRPPLEAFAAARVTLYRSTLRPQGALYEPLGTTDLPIAPAGG